jgi:Ca-activated chloride channel homolog
MRATDVRPTRLGATVAGMQTFIGELAKRFEIGVVSFSTTAKVVRAPTRNHWLVLQALGALSPQAATALGDGLAAAVRLTVASLADEGVRRVPGNDLPAVIVLESDGAQKRGTITPLQAGRRAKAAGLHVDGIALGTNQGVVKFGYGAYVSSVPVPPDPKTVAQIAQVTGGTSFTAPTADRLQAI